MLLNCTKQIMRYAVNISTSMLMVRYMASQRRPKTEWLISLFLPVKTSLNDQQDRSGHTTLLHTYNTLSSKHYEAHDVTILE